MTKHYLVDSSRNGRRTHLIKVKEDKVFREWGKAIGAFSLGWIVALVFAAATGLLLAGVDLYNLPTIENMFLVTTAVLSLLVSFVGLGGGLSEAQWFLRDRTKHSVKTYESFLGLAWRPQNVKGLAPRRRWPWTRTDHVTPALNDQLAERFADHDHSEFMEWRVW